MNTTKHTPEQLEMIREAALELLEACEAHAAWHWAEQNHQSSSFNERMELANFSQWKTAIALAKAYGMPKTDDYSGVPKMIIALDGARIVRATNEKAQSIVDRLIGSYRAAIAKATGQTP